MIEGAGAIDVVAASGVPGVLPLTPEALVAAAPDVLILPESGVGALGGIEGVLALPGVAETPAGRDGRFLVYDDGFFLNFGPRTGEALARLAADLYPELGG
jgi:iron complex transport system substrate-binding protein